MTTDDRVCSIRSTLDEHGKAACLIQWGPVEALLDPATVTATARDLMAAASSAETDIALVGAFREDLGADDQMLGVVLTKVRGRRPMSPTPVALRIEAVAGHRTGLPLVHIARGSMKGELSPDEARAMAVHWIEAAAAAQIDVRIRYALGEWDQLSTADIERLFTLMQGVQR